MVEEKNARAVGGWFGALAGLIYENDRQISDAGSCCCRLASADHRSGRLAGKPQDTAVADRFSGRIADKL